MPIHLPPTHLLQNLQLSGTNIINKPMQRQTTLNNCSLDGRMLFQHLDRLLNIQLSNPRRPRIVVGKALQLDFVLATESVGVVSMIAFQNQDIDPASTRSPHQIPPPHALKQGCNQVNLLPNGPQPLVQNTPQIVISQSRIRSSTFRVPADNYFVDFQMHNSVLYHTRRR